MEDQSTSGDGLNKKTRSSKWRKMKFFTIVIWMFCHYQVKASVPYYTSDEMKEREYRAVLPNEQEKKFIVDKHNYLRATVGYDGIQPIPADMRYMTWDDGLAYTSYLYASKCKWEHSLKSERRTHVWKYDQGENLWSGTGLLATEFDPEDAIMEWYDELKWYSFYNLTCKPDKSCDMYTQLVWAYTYKIGCAWAMCPTLKNIPGRNDFMLFVCHYAPSGNVETYHAYKIGPRCSQCGLDDTCWEDSICRNPTRDKPVPFTPPGVCSTLHAAQDKPFLCTTGGIAVISASVVLLLGCGSAIAYLWHIGKLQKALGRGKKKETSSVEDAETVATDKKNKAVEVESIQNDDTGTRL